MSLSNDILHPSFTTDPYWWDAAPPETTSPDAPLPREADVVVIGGGYCGMSAAIELRRQGIDVAVLDKGALGGGASTRATGGVTGGQKLVLAGPTAGVTRDQLAAMLRDSIASFAYLRNLLETEQLDAGFQQCGRFLVAYSEGHAKRLARMGALLREHTGVRVRDIARAQQREILASEFYHGGILIEDYGSIHPAKYHKSLRDLARRLGAGLYSHTPMLSVEQRDGKWVVATARGEIVAGRVIAATNGYTGTELPYLHPRLIPAASYHIATEPLPRDMIERLLPGGRMVSDSQRNLVAVRPSTDGTRIIFGARPSAHDRREEEAAPLIYRTMTAVLPQLDGVKVTHCWRGNVAMTFDRHPHIGEIDGIFFAVGCNGSGVAMMSYLGQQIARRLLSRQDRPSAFEGHGFPIHRWYDGRPWFVPLITVYYNLRDGLDRRFG